MNGKTELYRHFNEKGDLLYVGISFRSAYRMAVHAHESEWWDEVATITVERFANRDEARIAERDAIRAERPRYNKNWVEKPYKSRRRHGLKIDLPGAPEMAEAMTDWYISLIRSQKLPMPLQDLASKFDQNTDAGRTYAIIVDALEALHASGELLPSEDPDVSQAKYVGAKPGPPTLLKRMDKKELRALRKDLADPLMTWRKLHKKYGYAVATLRRHFEEERKQALLNLAADDEK